MSCSQCQRLPIGAIKSPTDLRHAISKVEEALNSNVLKYEGAGVNGEPFSLLMGGGLWGDWVSNYFSCRSCTQLFRLYAETYHGGGGALVRIDCIKETLA